MDIDTPGIVYGQSFDNLEKAIKQAGSVQKDIATNIANIESNNFVNIKFKDELERAKMKRADKNALLDNELTKLAENNLKMTSYAQLLSSKLKIMKKVVTLGKG
ncbi:MAG: hypothetical protein PHV30_07890 [Candidatus Margulisbacteria bacterium]|nr:hypothetical protein [Candidatus Margulisiibacteriota bacterium]